MDQPLTDRRMDARFPPPRAGVARVTLRPGCSVVLVDVSAGGALVQAGRPLRPGAKVHLQLVTTIRTFTLAAHVLRCAVWSLDAHDGVLYRGALKFDHRCDWLAELEGAPGHPVSSPRLSEAEPPQEPVLTGRGHGSALSRRSAK